MDPLNFTKIPHELLRKASKFNEPLDFLIYLHFFSYSWGWGRGREHASMGLSQLERFTGVSRNAVKRSLDRLIEQGWIKMVEEYERSRVTRKWKVKRIEATTAPFLTESKMNTVQNEQSPNQTLLVSKMDPVPGSKMDTYRESINKENTKNSLFRIPSA